MAIPLSESSIKTELLSIAVIMPLVVTSSLTSFSLTSSIVNKFVSFSKSVFESFGLTRSSKFLGIVVSSEMSALSLS
ncbi:MAG: hypothetical protein E7L45_00520 [Peptoniphilus lacydonensis]|jgi:hypothetical protein|uniref:hypothetical protein n=1 Tax=Peptoniphilus lacydonensis TaxID=1673725 RepID=UPI00258C2273|nr:hypothetical protein [Peptoniphilus lacydonensis]MDU7301776.1 hypothetical protein [Peptoniphilus lacydonensis]